MPRSLQVVGIFGILLLVLIGIEGIKSEYPQKDFVTHAMPHLIIVAISVVVGSVLLWIVEESIQHHIAPAILGGLRLLASQVAVEVKQFPERLASLPEVLDQIRQTIASPEVQHLLAQGNIKEAAKKAAGSEEHVAVLLQSIEPKDWDRALEVLRTLSPPPPRYFLSLAFRFWSADQTQRAIAVAEEGLRFAQQANDAGHVRKLQNSLAYYYAWSKDPRYEQAAREYVASARMMSPESVETIDTEGLIKITYGKTKDEVLEGVALAEQAKAQGLPFEYYAKAISRAQERLIALGVK